MKQNLLDYIEKIRNPGPVIASVMDKHTFFEVISTLYGADIYSKETLRNAEIFSVFYYEIPDWKKEFSIEMVRNAEAELALKPYEGKNIFVFEDFDTGGAPAQNATLKLLEDCPEYAVIILLVENPKKLLPTIESRIITFFEAENGQLDAETENLLNEFFLGNKSPWISKLYQHPFSTNEARLILISIFPKLPIEAQKKCQELIVSLENTNEKPNSLLEILFLDGNL